MLQKIPNAATRVSRPKMRPSSPKNSAAIARNANGAGMCIMPVKKPIVPVNPYPPNHPSIFWAPWAKNTTPSTNRRTVMAASLSVAVSLRIIKSSYKLIAEVGPTPDVMKYPYIRILFGELNRRTARRTPRCTSAASLTRCAHRQSQALLSGLQVRHHWNAGLVSVEHRVSGVWPSLVGMGDRPRQNLGLHEAIQRGIMVSEVTSRNQQEW